jgi:D-alanine-D-alanine ligase
MEILFKDRSNPRPVYDFQIKQEWEKHVSYQCPADLTPTELKAIERVVRETFAALDCRDVSRVDLRMDAKGTLYVIEVNPLPGLTPGYSDLCLIGTAAGIDYRTLIGEILSGGLKRLREKKRAEAARAEAARESRPDDPRQLSILRPPPRPALATNGSATAERATPERAVSERTPAPAERTVSDRAASERTPAPAERAAAERVAVERTPAPAPVVAAPTLPPVD